MELIEHYTTIGVLSLGFLPFLAQMLLLLLTPGIRFALEDDDIKPTHWLGKKMGFSYRSIVTGAHIALPLFLMFVSAVVIFFVVVLAEEGHYFPAFYALACAALYIFLMYAFRYIRRLAIFTKKVAKHAHAHKDTEHQKVDVEDWDFL